MLKQSLSYKNDINIVDVEHGVLANAESISRDMTVLA